MALTPFYRRRVPASLQGVVVDGLKLAALINVPLRDGMTKAKAVAFTEDILLRAKALVNYRLTDAEAFELATAITDQYAAIPAEDRDYQMVTEPGSGIPDARWWLARLGRTMNLEDIHRLQGWITRVAQQRYRLMFMKDLVRVDDPNALTGAPKEEARIEPVVAKVKSIRSVAGKSPLHSDVTRDYFASKRRPKNYRRALEQFREQAGDLEVHEYTEDHCWTFRNWLDEAKDEKKGEVLAGKTKNNKLSAVSSLFGFAIERRHRNKNPMRDVKMFSKTENVKKRRRLYTKSELEALFVQGERELEWHKWSPLLGLYGTIRTAHGNIEHPDARRGIEEGLAAAEGVAHGGPILAHRNRSQNRIKSIQDHASNSNRKRKPR